MHYLQRNFEYLIELAWLLLSLNQMCLLVTLNHNNQVETSIKTFHTRRKRKKRVKPNIYRLYIL